MFPCPNRLVPTNSKSIFHQSNLLVLGVNQQLICSVVITVYVVSPIQNSFRFTGNIIDLCTYRVAFHFVSAIFSLLLFSLLPSHPFCYFVVHSMEHTAPCHKSTFPSIHNRRPPSSCVRPVHNYNKTHLFSFESNNVDKSIRSVASTTSLFTQSLHGFWYSQPSTFT
jgi:hypothetical protein